MVYKIRIRRQESQKSDSYWQEFEFDGSKNSSVANVLKELNSRTPLKDNSGNIVTPISWECSCMVRKCGAHWREDYPKSNDDDYLKTTVARFDGKQIQISFVPVPERR